MAVHKHTINKQKFSKKSGKARIINEARRGPRTNLGIPIMLIIITAILVTGIFSQGTFYVFEESPFDGWFSSSNLNFVEDGTAKVIVNGETIYVEELDKQWNALPVQAKQQMTREDLLTQLVQERLLLQEAEKENIEVNNEEVNEFIKIQLEQSGISQAEFDQLLQNQGTNIEDMEIIYKKQLTIAKLFESFTSNDLNASEGEIFTYYADHKEEFYREEQVTVKHILIQVNENFNESVAQARVLEVEEQLDETNNENFCDLVVNYTSDIGSRDKCGEYTFAKGVMVEEFEDAAFNMNVNERRTVKTSFGYHIMLKEENIDKGYLGLSDTLIEYPGEPNVRTFIEQRVSQEKAKNIFETYITTLEEKAEITYIDEDIEEEIEVEEELNITVEEIEVEDVEEELNITIEEIEVITINESLNDTETTDMNETIDLEANLTIIAENSTNTTVY